MLTASEPEIVSCSPKVHVINADAFPWVDTSPDSYDFIVIDFPDPNQLLAGQALHDGVL